MQQGSRPLLKSIPVDNDLVHDDLKNEIKHCYMKKLFILSVVLFLVAPTGLLAQKKKSLSDKDKQAIVDIFRQLRAPYYLVFNRTEIYGSKDLITPIFSSDIYTKSGQAAGIFFRAHEEIGMWYAVQTGAGQPQTVEDVFGKTNASRLESIFKKYAIGNRRPEGRTLTK